MGSDSRGENQLEEQEEEPICRAATAMQVERTDSWTQQGKQRVGETESSAGHAHHHGRNSQPVGIRCVCRELSLGLRDNLEGWEVAGRRKRNGTHAYLRLVRIDLWEKPAQYCKANYPPSKTE